MLGGSSSGEELSRHGLGALRVSNVGGGEVKATQAWCWGPKEPGIVSKEPRNPKHDMPGGTAALES